VFAVFARLDWRDFGTWQAVRGPGMPPLGYGFLGRPLFGASLAPDHGSLTDRIAAEGIHNPVCAVALGDQVLPTSGVAVIHAARALEARTGQRVGIPTVVSGPSGMPPNLARREWVSVPLAGDDSVFNTLFKDPPAAVEVHPHGFLLFETAT
jgi:hypothetical protein